MIIKIKQYYFQLPFLLKLFFFIFLFTMSFGWAIHLIEPTIFPTLLDGVWWAIITGATVGYGDYVPHSTLGRLLTFALILAGGGAITFYMASIASATVKLEQQRLNGNGTFQGKQHIIIIGWNERSKALFNQLKSNSSSQQVILIDSTLTQLPMKYADFHYVKGDPTIERTGRAANAACAKKIIITADQSLTERFADQATILTIIALRALNNTVSITAEILTTHQVEHAKLAGANQIIESNYIVANLLHQEITTKN
ncbi:voltage-gated potassium channel [Amphibacillus marinus]|uniref:Voltage-gated potassium channel n=1 Tax=Amphibacillus marinus TaxID=872970 RepID=A0A1H8S0P1_9BACI|nr:potassium channel family protein [Amphibacillus marinus]SEO72230.1 voltage-gated potassium channel [Amphibacillus marinus]